MRSRFRLALVLGLGSLAVTLAGAEEPKRPWTDVAELGLIVTTGNSKATNFAAGNKFVYTWAASDFTLDATALRTEATDRVLSNPAGVAVETETQRKTAEAYALGGKYRMTVREGFLWYAHLGWTRNRFAGLSNRYYAGAGVGYRFLKNDHQSLAGEAGLNYNRETYVPGATPDSQNFADLRLFLGYEWKISETSKFTNDLEVLDNLKTTKDLRAKDVASVVANMTTKVALKAGLTLLYDNQPVEIVVPPDTIGVPLATFRFDKLDSIVSASLVINF